MKVLLVQAPSVESASSERVYPLGLVTLATHLTRAGHRVAMVDMNIESDAYGALKDKLLAQRPDVAAISLRNIDPLANKTSSLFPPFVVAVRMIHALLPDTPVIAGGSGFSLFPQRIMEEVPEIRYGIQGEAEHSLPGLLDSFDRPGDLPGLCSRRDGRVVVNPPSRDFRFEDYIVPDRSLLSPETYGGINSYAPVFGIETKRGCPLSCVYCVYPRLQGRAVRCRPPADVVDEIEMLQKKYGLRVFHFNDPVVNLPVGHLEEICQEILKRGLQINWTGFFREDVLDAEKVRLYEKSGLNCFSFSPDGLCTGSLKVLEKKLEVSDIIRAAELTAQTNIVAVYHFLANVPGENKETIRQGKALIERLYAIHTPKRNLGAIVLNNIRIMPGTPIEAIARDQGEIDENTDLLYPVYYNPGKYQTLRYELEIEHATRNVLMWQKVTT
ncbi:putative variant cofactor biosynthesis B12-binding/radical SAM domain protein 1 [Desulfosalsimonas propionicica]|uniref:Putative variant cofactor biosynthesis B12-binding/radical SAM domain protein 1 n=1 Tax=Desulfosalsimonas propionicica TaxID=332175 RepID=A0A7W0HLK0_9BACT|nr:B12 lower ligand biosynthesis radical SAM protein BzaD [Desulfosalsimonas propionicica]MBA2882066.1 putative variant cofactor biosynthesis B12-binding/radical SAM domain protein 1 [Desulfosalsimonas propionicica]